MWGRDQLNAKATRPEQSRTTPATVTARKLLEANSSRMAHHSPLGITGHRLGHLALTDRTTGFVAQSKGFPVDAAGFARVEDFGQHLWLLGAGGAVAWREVGTLRVKKTN